MIQLGLAFSKNISVHRESAVMNLWLGLSAAVVLVAGAWAGDCVVDDWHEWGLCKLTDACDRNRKGYSYATPMTDKWDKGRDRMVQGIKLKEKTVQEKIACLETGHCPQFAPKTTEGRHNCIDGMAADKPCRNVDQLSFVSIEDLGYRYAAPNDENKRGNDIWGWYDSVAQDDYVVVGLSGGSSFVRVTDPENPVVVGFLASRRNISSSWRDMKVVNDHAFIVSEAEDHGMQVVDMTQFRGRNDFREITADALYSEIGNSHNIISNPGTNYVYIVGATDITYDNICNAGLHIVDVSDPKNPRFAGCFSADGYVHDAQCVIYNGADTRYTGREICFCYNEDSLTIVDVTNKNSPSMISREEYSDSMYTHQGWLTENHNVVLLDDEQDELYDLWDNGRTRTYVWDVRDLRNPTLRNTHLSPEFSIDHNQYVKGDYTYQSNYEAGLRILRIDEASYSLNEVAYFDVLPQASNDVAFRGSWSNYPYLQRSSAVAVTSIEYGLYMVQPNFQQIQADLEAGNYAEQERTRDVIQADNDSECPATVQRRQCEPVQCQ